MQIYESFLNDRVFLRPGELEEGNAWEECEAAIINVFDDVKLQTLLGFGGAITESSAYNYSKLTPEQKKDFLEKYFGDRDGLSYAVCRLHMNSCDFSLDIYSCVEDGDNTLATFSLERERKYIIPMIKDIQEFSKRKIFFFISPWSPPAYMKDNHSVLYGGKLKEEYKDLWALYYCKYIQAYRAEGIDIPALTIQNEPKADQPWESCIYTAEEERDFLENHLIPALDQNGLSDIKIMIWDHNKERVFDRAKTILTGSKYADRIFAVAFHWYSGEHFDGLDLVYHQLHKDTFLSEMCWGLERDVTEAAELYAKEICEDLCHYAIAICDWNILLSENGGPYHNRTAESTSVAGIVFESKDGGMYAPVQYDNPKQELVYTPIYSYISHFARFIKPGAVRLATTRYTDLLHACAFENPDGSKAAVLLNVTDTEYPVLLRYHDKITEYSSKPHSMTTFVLS